MFATSFVLYGQLVAKELGTLKIDEDRFKESLVALNDFKDRTSENIPQYLFWQ